MRFAGYAAVRTAVALSACAASPGSLPAPLSSRDASSVPSRRLPRLARSGRRSARSRCACSQEARQFDRSWEGRQHERRSGGSVGLVDSTVLREDATCSEHRGLNDQSARPSVLVGLGGSGELVQPAAMEHVAGCEVDGFCLY